MAWFKRLVSRLKTAVRRWHLSPKPRPMPNETQTPMPAQETGPTPSPSPAFTLRSPYISGAATTKAPAPAPAPAPALVTTTAIPVSVPPSSDDEPTDLAQIRRQWPSLPPPQVSTDEEQLPHTAQRIPRQRQQQQQGLSIQPPADEVRKHGPHNVDRLSPGEWDWSARASRCTSVSSGMSTSRASSQSRGSMDTGSLRNQLRRNRVVFHRNPRLYFIPVCQQDLLLTIPNIENDIRDSDTDHMLEQGKIVLLAEKAYKSARKLYAILAYLRKGLDIRFLLDMEISDEDLPFKRLENSDGKAVLKRKSGKTIEAFGEWDDGIIEEFDRIQWWMLAIVFENKEHYDLDDGAILPFMNFKAHANMKQENEGGFSDVYPARIHPSHHKFWTSSDDQDNEQLVAIKQLHSTSQIEFEKERSMHIMLDSKVPHPHRITLLATFKHDRRYHLIFPYAEANLKKYWEDRPSPSVDRGTVYWCFKQMAGIADSLQYIHDLNDQCSLGQDGAVRLRKDASTSVIDSPNLFGRHGDIKPQNTLWFQQSPGSSSSIGSDGSDDNRGILKLADFGLSRVHGSGSRSNVPWDEVVGSPTYEPPECALHLPISRAYDIWSLGCLYLEFITWLLKGFEAVTCFTRTRASAATGWGSDDERFFSIVDGDPAVRAEVLAWVTMLHKHEKCSALIHDLLRIIMRDLLCPNAGQRADAKQVVHLLESCLKTADEDDDYILKPVPLQQQSADDSSPHSTSSFSLVSGNTTATERNSVTSKYEETAVPAMDGRLKFPKDLLGRGYGTPGQRIMRSMTNKL